MSFLAATVVSRFHPEYAKYLYAFSFIVVLSRVYVGVHFPGDVLAGVIIGIMIGKGMLMVAERKRIFFGTGKFNRYHLDLPDLSKNTLMPEGFLEQHHKHSSYYQP